MRKSRLPCGPSCQGCSSDGWGRAAIAAKKTTIVKEPINADESDTATALPDRDPLHAPLFIGHVRAASRGRKSPANTHPFTRPFGGGAFTFAHNGTLDVARLKKTVGPDFTPEEQTNSELDEEKEPEQRGYVLASRPLTDGEDWTSCRPGRLLVIERGCAVFGG